MLETFRRSGTEQDGTNSLCLMLDSQILIMSRRNFFQFTLSLLNVIIKKNSVKKGLIAFFLFGKEKNPPVHFMLPSAICQDVSLHTCHVLKEKVGKFTNESIQTHWQNAQCGNGSLSAKSGFSCPFLLIK